MLKHSLLTFKLPPSQLFTDSSRPIYQPSSTPPIKPNGCPLHQLAALPVTLATRPGSCPAPLAQLKSCHFLIESGLSFSVCSRFPIWQWSPLFSAKRPEKTKRRKKGGDERTLLRTERNPRFKTGDTKAAFIHSGGS